MARIGRKMDQLLASLAYHSLQLLSCSWCGYIAVPALRSEQPKVKLLSEDNLHCIAHVASDAAYFSGP